MHTKSHGIFLLNMNKPLLSSGPIAGALVDRFGCRLVAMAGSLIASFGFGISYFAKNLVFLYFSVGVTGGNQCSLPIFCVHS